MYSIPERRLRFQGISAFRGEDPSSLVRRFGAVQAQDYGASLWALGLRIPGSTEVSIEAAIATGSILRTWPMRGTIHFVHPADAQWMLAFTAPRIIASHYKAHLKEFGLELGDYRRAAEAAHKALSGGKRLEREDLYAVFDNAGVSSGDSRGLHLIWRLAQEGLICIGPREGKQPTYVLLDEWVLQAPGWVPFVPADASAEYALRYFRTHGPATVHDFAWWTGMNLGEARTAVDAISGELVTERFGDRVLLSAAENGGAETGTAAHPVPRVNLIPAFDEYLVGYTDRSDVHTPRGKELLGARFSVIFNWAVILDGQVAGTWKRKIGKKTVEVEVTLSMDLGREEKVEIEAAAQRYGVFTGLPVDFKIGVE